MLFFIQMKWNHENRLSLDELWDLEVDEMKVVQENIDSGVVVGIYKVAAQKRLVAIVDVESIEELDRTALGRLPMKEYLEFETVWALRDYQGFGSDVKVRYNV